MIKLNNEKLSPTKFAKQLMINTLGMCTEDWRKELDNSELLTKKEEILIAEAVEKQYNRIFKLLCSTKKAGRKVEYIGQIVTISDYEEKHYYKNQNLIQGVPVDPVLRPDFNQTSNNHRDYKEVEDWWGKPFIVTDKWEADDYKSYLKRVSSFYKKNEIETEEEFNISNESNKKSWFEAWPEGTRYDVRCLDGGAWDRSTDIGMFGTLEKALTVAKSIQE